VLVVLHFEIRVFPYSIFQDNSKGSGNLNDEHGGSPYSRKTIAEPLEIGLISHGLILWSQKSH
jgi:hypothetical protein